MSLLLDVVVGLQRQDDDTLGERPGPGHRRPPAAEIHVTRLESAPDVARTAAEHAAYDVRRRLRRLAALSHRPRKHPATDRD